MIRLRWDGKRVWGTLSRMEEGDTQGGLSQEPGVMLSTCTFIFPMSSCHNSEKGDSPISWIRKPGWVEVRAGGWGQMTKPPDSMVGKMPLPRTSFFPLP